MVAFAGQMTGVEGYVESTASGFLAAVAMAAKVKGEEIPEFATTVEVNFTDTELIFDFYCKFINNLYSKQYLFACCEICFSPLN